MSVQYKLAAAIWIMAGTVLAGVCVLAVLLIPGLAGHEIKVIPFAALAGFAAAIPLAHSIARQIGAV